MAEDNRTLKDKFAELKAPFPESDIEWRLQSSGKSGKIWAICLVYLTNRAIMERLDDVFSPENWKNEYTQAPDGGVLCGISIRVGDEWVTKWDGAESTDIEKVKGGLSGAMKRAAVQWGIGRYLYKLKEGFAIIADNGTHRGSYKDKDTNKYVSFKWNPPSLPAFALPPVPTEDEKKKFLAVMTNELERVGQEAFYNLLSEEKHNGLEELSEKVKSERSRVYLLVAALPTIKKEGK